MKKSAVYRRIIECGILPTMFVYGEDENVQLAKTLFDNGIRVVEILQRAPGAAEAIQTVKQRIPGMVAGAGTVRSIETAQAAVAAGADFIVTPYYSQEIIDWCNEREIPVIPGCATITEVSLGYRSGLRYFKYFPVKQLGGVEVIRQISEIYSDVRYVVTGGISYEDLLEFAQNPYVMAVGTTCMMPSSLVKSHDWSKIADLTAASVAGILGMELAYVDRSMDHSLWVLLDLLRRYTRARGRLPEVPETIRCMGRDHTAGLYTNSLERALAFLGAYGMKSEILLCGDTGIPVVADLQIPMSGDHVRLIAKHYICGA